MDHTEIDAAMLADAPALRAIVFPGTGPRAISTSRRRGRKAIRIGAALGMKVLAWSRSGVPAGLPCAARPLDALLAESHVVSLHLALTPETAGILDRRRLGLMRPGAILVNTARGGLVDEAALIDALRAGRPAHAALDVFADEPPSADSPLRRLENVTLTAHAGFMTREASVRLLRAGFTLIAEERARMGSERRA